MKLLKITILLPLAITLLISGCSFTSFSGRQISPTVQDYLNLASQNQGDEQHYYQLLAAGQLLDDNNLNDAEQLLQSLNRIPLNPNNTQQKIILESRLTLQKNQPKLALKILHNVHNLKALPKPIQIAYFTTASQAHLRNNNLAYCTLAQISLNALLQDDSQLPFIWHNLQTLPTTQLNTLLNRSTSPLLRGWLELAILAKVNANHPETLVSAIQNWETTYPNHPANKLIPNTQTLSTASTIKIPNQIALLLPLHGTFAAMGQAIRDGFMTAYYQQSKDLVSTPKIKLYDTSLDEDINDIYNQALTEGADFIIGPLTKSNVKELSNHDSLPVPTITLNYLPANQNAPTNLIQYGLSPEQAANQAASKAWQLGINNILIIVPQNDWGNTIQNAFITRWQSLGGNISDTLFFSMDNNINTEITSILHIDQSQAREKELKQLLGEKLKMTLRRRQDINGIFLVATPSQARQIRPLLSYYYAGNLPVVSISTIYAGYRNTLSDRDLNNIYFNDIPLLLSQNPTIVQLRQQFEKLWPDNYRLNNRLFGLGFDSFHLSLLFNRLIALPNFAIEGATGQLYLNNNQIIRELSWAKFINGIPQI